MSKVFKDLTSIEEALRILRRHILTEPLGSEEVSLYEARGRVLAEDVTSPVDVPPFNRASMDGYAVRAEDINEAGENNPVLLRVVERIVAGSTPSKYVSGGEAAEIGTGAPIPGGANAVVMVEYTDEKEGQVYVYRKVVAGENIQSAGSDVRLGETILRRGDLLTPREVGLLAAAGKKMVVVFRKTKVAFLSIGDEIAPHGVPLDHGRIYDVNGPALSASLSELGIEAQYLGVVGDDPKLMEKEISEALASADVVLTSGSTSAGTTDILNKVLNGLGKPGVIVHGLSIKPGKPTMLAVVRGKPIFGLPGYPTSALTVFKVMVEPILREMAGQPPNAVPRVEAEVRERIYGVQGRKYLLPVSLQRSEKGLVATPVPGGSGAVTSLAKADGYIEVPEGVEYLEEGEEVAVELFSQKGSIPDVVVIGSHSRGMDLILELMRDEIPELVVRVINVGSMNGLLAVKRGEADIAGICLLDEKTGRYNKDFPNRYGIGESLLVRGYERELGLIVEKGNPLGLKELRDMLRGDVRFINRDKGSSVRTLIEMTLKKLASKSDRSYQEIVDEIEGFEVVSKTHRAVVAAVAHGTVNLGVAARPYVEDVDVDFIPVGYECFDFLVRGEALEKKEVKLFLQVLASDRFRERASSLLGIRVNNRCGEPVS